MSATDTEGLRAVDDEEQLAREADEAGLSIEELAAKRAAEPEQVDEGEQMQFPGTQSSLTLNAGGDKPTSAQAKVAAISLPMPPQEQLNMKDEVLVTMRCRVKKVDFEALEKGGVQRSHVLKPIELLEVRPPAPGE